MLWFKLVEGTSEQIHLQYWNHMFIRKRISNYFLMKFYVNQRWKWQSLWQRIWSWNLKINLIHHPSKGSRSKKSSPNQTCLSYLQQSKIIVIEEECALVSFTANLIKAKGSIGVAILSWLEQVCSHQEVLWPNGKASSMRSNIQHTPPYLQGMRGKHSWYICNCGPGESSNLRMRGLVHHKSPLSQ